MWRIYEYLEKDGLSTIKHWLRHEAVSQRDRGQLVAKMDMLAMHGTTLMSGLLAGPIKSKKQPKNFQSHIYKLVIHGDRMLRPMLCRGPIDMDGEFTMLIGAIEVGGKLNVDATEAEARRQEILKDSKRRELNGRYKRSLAAGPDQS